jgi:hypothetical protein
METPTAQPPRRNWWQRNWKWFVPTGCLTLLALLAAFICCIVVFVFSVIKTSDAYVIAVQRAKSDQRVAAALGTPIKEGWYVAGSTNVSGGSGQADLSIPISGPKSKATIYAKATKSAGKWKYSQLQVRVATSDELIELQK